MVLCMDEKSQVQAYLDRTQPSLPMKKGRAPVHVASSRGHRVTRPRGGVRPAAGGAASLGAPARRCSTARVRTHRVSVDAVVEIARWVRAMDGTDAGRELYWPRALAGQAASEVVHEFFDMTSVRVFRDLPEAGRAHRIRQVGQAVKELALA